MLDHLLHPGKGHLIGRLSVNRHKVIMRQQLLTIVMHMRSFDAIEVNAATIFQERDAELTLGVA